MYYVSQMCIYKLQSCPWICSLHLNKIEYTTNVHVYKGAFIVVKPIWDLFCTIWPDQLLYNQNKRMFSYNLDNCDFAVFYILIYSLFETQRLKLILSMAFTNHDNLGLRSDCQIKFWKKTSKDYPSLVWIKLTRRYKRKMFTKICKNSTLFTYLWQNP